MYDAVHLIHEILERHINKKLSDRFGRHFKVDTYVIVLESRDYWRFEEKRWNWSMDCNVERRDAFFLLSAGCEHNIASINEFK